MQPQVLRITENEQRMILEYTDQNGKEGIIFDDNPFKARGGGYSPPLYLIPPEEVTKQTLSLVSFRDSVKTLPDSDKVVPSAVSALADLAIPEDQIAQTYVQHFTDMDDVTIVLVGSPEFIKSRTVKFDDVVDDRDRMSDPDRIVHCCNFVKGLFASEPTETTVAVH